MVSKANQIEPPNDDDTVLWLRLTFEHLKDIKPGSALAKQILHDVTVYESAWRPAYINAVERNIVNPTLMVAEDAPISAPTELDGEDGAYVMCWQFIPHSSVIPPTREPSSKEINRSLGRLAEVANNLESE